jgi:hypothetical protein
MLRPEGKDASACDLNMKPLNLVFSYFTSHGALHHVPDGIRRGGARHGHGRLCLGRGHHGKQHRRRDCRIVAQGISGLGCCELVSSFFDYLHQVFSRFLIGGGNGTGPKAKDGHGDVLCELHDVL